jgi:hypothetical protein
VRGAALDLHPQDEHALGLDTDVEVGRLAADDELAEVAVVGEVCRRLPLARLDLGLLVGDDEQLRLDAGDGVAARGQVAERGQHRRERPLHVVRTAAVQPAVDLPRRELLAAPRHHVDVGVPDDRRRALPHRGDERGQAVHLVLAVRDPPRVEPPLHELRRLAEPLGPRGVVGDQALGERELVGDEGGRHLRGVGRFVPHRRHTHA